MPSIDVEYYTTAASIAKAAEVTRKTACEWVQKDTFPEQVKGRGWPRLEVDAWVADALKEAAAHQTGKDADLKRRKLLLQCQKIEKDIEAKAIENKKALGELEPKSNRIQALTQYAGIVRRTLATVGKDCAELCANPAVRDIVDQKIDGVLSELYKACAEA
jgi:predicted DNA-binding transcriptional regulator AlpA